MKFDPAWKARRPGLASTVVVASLLAWTVSLGGPKAMAGEASRRAVFEIEVEIENGRERWKNGTEWKEGAFSQSFTLNIPYVAAPELDGINPYDPGYGANSFRDATATRSRAATVDGGPGFAEPPPARFQRWEMEWGTEGDCGATLLADYRYDAADALKDVTGPVLGRETAIGASEGAVIASERPIVCSSNQIITDVKTGRLYLQSFYMPAIPVRQTIESKLRGGLLKGAASGGLPGGPDIVRQWTVTQWIAGELSGAPLESHAERAFKIQGNMNGVSLPTALSGVREIVPDEDPTAWKRQAPNFHETEFVAKVTWRLSQRPPSSSVLR